MKLRPIRVRLSPRAGWQPTQPPSERSTDVFYAVSAPTYLLLILLLPSLPEPLTEILQIKKIKCLHLFTLCVCLCTQAQVHTHIIAHMCGSRTTVCRIRTLHLDSRGQTQVIRHGSKCPYQLSHLSSPLIHHLIPPPNVTSSEKLSDTISHTNILFVPLRHASLQI